MLLRFTAFLLVAVVVAEKPNTSNADIVSFDDFESYSLGTSVVNGAGGSGWTSSWQAANTSDIATISSGLSANGVNGGHRGLEIDGTTSSFTRLHRFFAPQSTNELYFRFLMKIPDIGVVDDGRPVIEVGFYNGTRSNILTDYRQHTSWIEFLDRPSVFNGIFACTGDSNGNCSTGAGAGFPVSSSQTLDIVLGVTPSSTDIWFNPSPGALPDETTGSRGSPSDFSAVSLRFAHRIDSVLTLDELVVATSREDFGLGGASAAVPEPSAFVLLSFLGGAIAYRQRNKKRTNQARRTGSGRLNN